MNKLLLLSSLLLTGCFDLAYAPIWGVEGVAGGARGHIKKYDLPDGVEKQAFMQEVQNLIKKVEWIDNYNQQTTGEKIYLETRNLDGWSCVYFSSYEELPLMGMLSFGNVYFFQEQDDCKLPTGVNKEGFIRNQEDKEYNNNRFKGLRKYYAVSSGRTFIYILDELKKQNKTFPNIPVRGLAIPDREKYVISSILTESKAMQRYVRSIFNSNNYSDKMTYPYENRVGHYNIYGETNAKFYDSNNLVSLYLIDKK